MNMLVLAEHDNTSIAAAVWPTVTAACELGDKVHILVAGHDCRRAAEAAAGIAGVSKVLLADHEQFDHGLAETLAPLVAELAGDYSHVLAPASTWGKNIIPRAAALRDVQPISDVSGVVDADTFVRPIYAGNAIATVRSHDSIKLITVRGTAFEPAAKGGQADIAAIEFTPPQVEGIAFGSEDLTISDRPELTSARIVISGGRGLGSSDAFDKLERVAERLGAAVGASRAAVDAGYVPNDYQVGQTGKIVAPDLYIAVGISGAIQHLAGMKDSKIIVAINKDEEAPIFQVADYGLVADLFTAVPELIEKL